MNQFIVVYSTGNRIYMVNNHSSMPVLIDALSSEEEVRKWFKSLTRICEETGE